VKWLPEWIDTAHDIVQAEFDQSYAHLPILENTPASQVSQVDAEVSTPALTEGMPHCSHAYHNSAQAPHQNIFDQLPLLSAPAPVEHCDDLECFLSTDLEQCNIVIQWHKHCAMYLCLSRMALDYLTIPGEFSFFFPLTS
jgi:hypothetical protein